MAAVTILSFESRKIQSVTVSIFSPSICHEGMELDDMILVFGMLRFKAAFSQSSFTFIKRLFSSSLLSASGVISCAYLRLLIFLPAILIPAWASFSPAFYTMYKLNKQDDNIQFWQTPFPIWNQSVASGPVLTVASWTAYSFIKWSDKNKKILPYGTTWTSLEDIILNVKSQSQMDKYYMIPFIFVVQSLNRVLLFVTQWTAAHQDFLSFTICQSLLKLISIRSVMPSNNFVHCCLLLFLPSIFPASGSFLMSWLFASGGQSIGVSVLTWVFPMHIQDWFSLEFTGLISLQSKGLPRVFSNTTVQYHQFFGTQPS